MSLTRQIKGLSKPSTCRWVTTNFSILMKISTIWKTYEPILSQTMIQVCARFCEIKLKNHENYKFKVYFFVNRLFLKYKSYAPQKAYVFFISNCIYKLYIVNLKVKGHINQSLIVTLSAEKFPSTNFQLIQDVKFYKYLALTFL